MDLKVADEPKRLNSFQKTGVFLTRIVGLLAVLIGLLGLGYFAGVRFELMAAAPYRPPSLIGSLLWLAVGVILLRMSIPVGRWLGRGLDA